MQARYLALISVIALVAVSCATDQETEATSTTEAVTTTSSATDTTEAGMTTTAGGGEASGDPIRIGAIFPLSGPQARNGQASFEGAEIAVDLFNSRGGACDRPVELVVQDAPEPSNATTAANTLIDTEQVPAIITDTSALALAVAPVAERAGVVMWETEGIAGPITGQGHQYVFRPPFSAGQMVQRMAEFVAGEFATSLGKPAAEVTVAMVHIDTGFGEATAAGFEAAAQEQGLQIVFDEAYPPDATDLSSLVLQIREAEPDVLLAASFIGDAILLEEQMAGLDYEPPLTLGTTAAQGTGDFREALGADVNGTVVGGIPSKVAEDKISTDLIDLYNEVVEQSGDDVDVLTLNGFDMTWVFLNHVIAEVCDEDLNADAIRDQILSLDLPEGSTIQGYGVQFAPADHPQSGQNLRAIAPVMQWQDESLEIILPESVATSSFQAPGE